MLPTGVCAEVACVWEVTARKPGNVQRSQDFADISFVDFLLSAMAIAPVLNSADTRPVGQTVRVAVHATRQVVRTNSNLGMVLLLAPLAAVPSEVDLRTGLGHVLSNLDREDARHVYAAIRLAAPGGLGRAPEQDVRDEPTGTLREVMALAADRDLVARQYANGFREVLDAGLPAFFRGLEETGTVEGAIIACHLLLMATYPDSLIARKCGPAVADESAERARRVLAAGWPRREPGRAALAELDAWLRADGHRRNPGTSADLVTASLFIALREGRIQLPCPYPWSAEPAHG